MTPYPVETLIKVLQAVTVVCQQNGCETAATHLFQSASIAAYCDYHARLEADRMGIDLPIPVTKAPRSASAAALNSSVA